MKTIDSQPKLTSLLPLVGGYKLTYCDGKYDRQEFQKTFAYVDEHNMKNFGCLKDDVSKKDTKFAFYAVTSPNGVTHAAKTFVSEKQDIFFTKSQVKDMFATHPHLFQKDAIYLFPYRGGYYAGIEQFMIRVYPQYENGFRRFLRKIGNALGIVKNTASWALDVNFGLTGSLTSTRQILVLPDSGVCLN